MIAEVLPVDREAMPELLLSAFGRVQPDVVVGLGEAPRRTAVTIERVALNLEDYSIPDNRGKMIQDQPINPNGPAAYFVTLPVRAICEAVIKEGIACELSLSAGAYLCNQMLYTMLAHLAGMQLSVPAGFIHLPSLPGEDGAPMPGLPSMNFEDSLRTVRIAIETISDWMQRR